VVLSDGRDARSRVVGFVSAERPRVKAAQARVIQQLRHRVALRCACRAGELKVDQESVTVLHQCVAMKANLASNPRPFLASRASGSVVLW